MSLFEYVTVAFSFLLSLGVARLVSGLPAILEKERRFDLHVSMTLGFLLSTPMLFWVVWSFREVAWTLPAFYLLLSMSAWYLTATVFLVPEQKETVDDWKAYYFERRRGIFFSFVALIFTSTLCRLLLRDNDVLGLRSIAPAFLMIAFTCMAISDREVVHRALGLVILVAFAVIAFLNRSTDALP